MKILVYSHFFAPSVGGVETVVTTLASGLAELRAADDSFEFEITLVTQTPRGTFLDAELPFRVIRRPGAAQLWSLIKQVDAVHVAGPAILPILMGLLAQKPVIVEHHGFQTICPTGQMVQEPEMVPCPGHFMAGRHSYCLRCSAEPQHIASLRLWIFTFFRRFLCRHVTVNIAPTAWLAEQLQLPRCETVPHGLPVARPLAPLEMRGEVPVLLFIGRLVTAKGLRTLLDAVRRLKGENLPCELLVVGAGPDRKALENYAQDSGIREHVHFLGRVPESQLPRTLARVDVVVTPSLGGEVFGMVLVENMFRALPIVASDLGAYREVLGDGGRTFRTGDAADLAAQVSLMLHDPVAARRCGVAARERALSFFSARSMIEGHARIYRRLMPARDPR